MKYIQELLKFVVDDTVQSPFDPHAARSRSLPSALLVVKHEAKLRCEAARDGGFGWPSATSSSGIAISLGHIHK